MTTWSPVIITGRMPASRQTATASRASSRGGSIMPTRPRKVSPVSSVSGSERLGQILNLTHRDCQHAQPLRLISSLICRAQPILPAAHSGAMPSNAPLTITSLRPPCSTTTDMRLRSESNGSSAMRGKPARSASFVSPNLCAAKTIAVSVGSPICVAVPSGRKGHGAVAAERRRAHERACRRVAGIDRPGRTIEICLLQRHAVLRQRAGFIGADHRSAAQRFYGGQAADDRVFFTMRCPDRKHDGDDRRQTSGIAETAKRNGRHKRSRER